MSTTRIHRRTRPPAPPPADAGDLEPRTYAFALGVIRLYARLRDRKEYTLGKALLRSGTSIGANVVGAGAAARRRDVVAKMAIAGKEARETAYWLRLLRDGGLAGGEEVDELLAECDALIRALDVQTRKKQKTNGGPNP